MFQSARSIESISNVSYHSHLSTDYKSVSPQWLPDIKDILETGLHTRIYTGSPLKVDESD